MSSPRRRGLITRLRNAADKLEEEANIARHRLEIGNLEKGQLMVCAASMRDAVTLLEGLDD